MYVCSLKCNRKTKKNLELNKTLQYTYTNTHTCTYIYEYNKITTLINAHLSSNKI